MLGPGRAKDLAQSRQFTFLKDIFQELLKIVNICNQNKSYELVFPILYVKKMWHKIVVSRITQS